MFGFDRTHQEIKDEVKDYRDVFSEMNKTGFERFVENQKDLDVYEKASEFLNKYLGFNNEKIIDIFESDYYPKNTKYARKTYMVKFDSQRDFDYYNAALKYNTHLITIDKNYPIYAYFYTIDDDIDEKEVYIDVYVGKIPSDFVVV